VNFVKKGQKDNRLIKHLAKRFDFPEFLSQFTFKDETRVNEFLSLIQQLTMKKEALESQVEEVESSSSEDFEVVPKNDEKISV